MPLYVIAVQVVKLESFAVALGKFYCVRCQRSKSAIDIATPRQQCSLSGEVSFPRTAPPKAFELPFDSPKDKRTVTFVVEVTQSSYTSTAAEIVGECRMDLIDRCDVLRGASVNSLRELPMKVSGSGAVVSFMLMMYPHGSPPPILSHGATPQPVQQSASAAAVAVAPTTAPVAAAPEPRTSLSAEAVRTLTQLMGRYPLVAGLSTRSLLPVDVAGEIETGAQVHAGLIRLPSECRAAEQQAAMIGARLQSARSRSIDAENFHKKVEEMLLVASQETIAALHKTLDALETQLSQCNKYMGDGADPNSAAAGARDDTDADAICDTLKFNAAASNSQPSSDVAKRQALLDELHCIEEVIQSCDGVCETEEDVSSISMLLERQFRLQEQLAVLGGNADNKPAPAVPQQQPPTQVAAPSKKKRNKRVTFSDPPKSLSQQVYALLIDQAALEYELSALQALANGQPAPPLPMTFSFLPQSGSQQHSPVGVSEETPRSSSVFDLFGGFESPASTGPPQSRPIPPNKPSTTVVNFLDVDSLFGVSPKEDMSTISFEHPTESRASRDKPPSPNQQRTSAPPSPRTLSVPPLSSFNFRISDAECRIGIAKDASCGNSGPFSPLLVLVMNCQTLQTFDKVDFFFENEDVFGATPPLIGTPFVPVAGAAERLFAAAGKYVAIPPGDSAVIKVELDEASSVGAPVPSSFVVVLRWQLSGNVCHRSLVVSFA